MTRRELLATAAAIPAVASGPVVWLEAVAGPCLPHRIPVPAALVGAGVIFELRTYSDARTAAAVWDRLTACGRLSTRLPGLRTLLIPFESLAHREQAWRKFQADPEWEDIRDRREISYRFSLYRREK